MRILAGTPPVEGSLGPAAVALGIFDGVHLGHQALLRGIVAVGTAQNLVSLVYTFHPHPAHLLAPDRAPPLIEPVELRLGRMAELDIGAVLVETFDAEFAAIDAETFVTDLLVRRLAAKHVVVGEDFRFGNKAVGDVGLLSRFSKTHGFSIQVMPPVLVDGATASSTRIRKLVLEGDVAAAARLLGRPFTLLGSVGRGAGRGMKIGVPTANLRPQNELIPATGVYAGRAVGPFPDLPCVVNIGVNPTFGGGELKIEAHLLDYSGPAFYGASLELCLIERLRGEQRFAGVDALKEQIQLDIDRARALLSR